MRILTLGLLLISVNANAAALAFSSGERQVNIVELFTSEGCSSCPPAEHWLNSLQSESRLWDDLVPIAFHVDYWDYIGWKDAFAQAAFNTRQHRYAAQGGAGFVYTPGMFRNGEEWVGWRSGDTIVDDLPRAHDLQIAINDGTIVAAYHVSDDDPLVLNVALLGMGLETQVRAGENKGRTLQHDFVALALETVPLEPLNGFHTAKLTLPQSAITAKRHALVAWVSRPNVQTPLQATGGFID